MPILADFVIVHAASLICITAGSVLVRRLSRITTLWHLCVSFFVGVDL